MPIDTHPARRGRHPEKIIKEQKAQAEKDKARANARKTVARFFNFMEILRTGNG